MRVISVIALYIFDQETMSGPIKDQRYDFVRYAAHSAVMSCRIYFFPQV